MTTESARIIGSCLLIITLMFFVLPTTIWVAALIIGGVGELAREWWGER